MHPGRGSLVVEGPVVRAGHVHPDAVDQFHEGGEGDWEDCRGPAQRREDRIRRSRIDPRDRGFDLVERRPLRFDRQVSVADVVDPPGHRVDRGHGLSLRHGKQADAVPEVSSAGARALVDSCVAWAQKNNQVVAIAILV